MPAVARLPNEAMAGCLLVGEDIVSQMAKLGTNYNAHCVLLSPSSCMHCPYSISLSNVI